MPSTPKASRAVSTKSNQSSCAFYLHSNYSNIFSFLDIQFGTEQADVFTLYGALHVYTCILLSFFSLILVISRNVLWNLSFNSKLCRSVSNRRYILEKGCKKNELWINNSSLLTRQTFKHQTCWISISLLNKCLDKCHIGGLCI